MLRTTLVSSALALIAMSATATTGARAQVFTLNMGGAWSIVGQPANQQVINNFTSSNGAGGFITGGASATVQMPGFIIGAATVQGMLPADRALCDGRTATAGGITFFSHPTGGTAIIDATVSPGPTSALSRGQTGSGVARTTVAFTCPLFGWLRGTSIARYTTNNAFGVIQTLPQTASATASGLTSFQTNASAGAIADGCLNSVGDAMQLNSNMYATVDLTLL